jgi:hypothetical protein
MNLTFQAPVMAGMVSNSKLSAGAQTELQRDAIRTMVAREDIRSHLLNNGVSPEDVNARIDTMTADEIAAFESELANLPAGEGFFGAFVALIVIFMLLDMAGVTDVFPRI